MTAISPNLITARAVDRGGRRRACASAAASGAMTRPAARQRAACAGATAGMTRSPTSCSTGLIAASCRRRGRRALPDLADRAARCRRPRGERAASLVAARPARGHPRLEVQRLALRHATDVRTRGRLLVLPRARPARGAGRPARSGFSVAGRVQQRASVRGLRGGEPRWLRRSRSRDSMSCAWRTPSANHTHDRHGEHNDDARTSATRIIARSTVSRARPMSASTAVSVVIPNWNGREWLPGCLEALAAQWLAPARGDRRRQRLTDGSIDYLRAEHPGVRVLALGAQHRVCPRRQPRARGRAARVRRASQHRCRARPDWLARMAAVAGARPGGRRGRLQDALAGRPDPRLRRRRHPPPRRRLRAARTFRTRRRPMGRARRGVRRVRRRRALPALGGRSS